MCGFHALAPRPAGWITSPCVKQKGLLMNKGVVVIAALLALLSVAGCTTYGKAPIGKAPVTAKG